MRVRDPFICVYVSDYDNNGTFPASRRGWTFDRWLLAGRAGSDAGFLGGRNMQEMTALHPLAAVHRQ